MNGAIAPWAKQASPYQTQTLQALADHYGFNLKTSWNKLSDKVHDVILNGTGEEEIEFVYDDGPAPL